MIGLQRERVSEGLWKSGGCSAGQHLSFVWGDWELSKPLMCWNLDKSNRV